MYHMLHPPWQQSNPLIHLCTSESPSDDDRPRSSSSEEHSYVESTLSPASSAPQTPSEIHPPPELTSPTSRGLGSTIPAPTGEVSSPTPTSVGSPPSPPRPENKYIRELYEDGVPFILYRDLIITNKLGQVRISYSVIIIYYVWSCSLNGLICP